MVRAQEKEERSDERRRDGVTIKFPWGITVQLRGLSVISSLTFVAVCVIAYLLWDHRFTQAEYDTELTIAMKQLAKSQNEMNYILTLTPDQRAKLDLAMPESLRQKLNTREMP